MAKRNQRKKTAQRAHQKATSPSARLREAADNVHSGNFDKALTLAQLVLTRDHDETTQRRAKQIVAEAHFRAAAATVDPAERLHHLDAAIAQTPDDARLHYHRAFALSRLGQMSAASAALDTVAKLDPQRENLEYLRATLRIGAGETPAVDGLSADAANTVRLVATMVNGAKPPALQTALQEAPSQPIQPHLWRALAQMQADTAAAPLELLENALADSAEGVRPLVHYYWGVAAMRQKDAEGAHEAWRQAAQQVHTPWLLENVSGAARARLSQWGQEGRWQAVIDAYQKSPAAVEQDAVLGEVLGIAHVHLGFDAAQQGDWPTAARHWRRASDYIGSRHLAQNLALAEEALDQWTAAAEAWRAMVRRRPRKETHPDYLTDAQVAAIWGHAADCYVHDENIAESITCLKNAIKYDEKNVELRTKLVANLVYEGSVDAAENELQRILTIDADYIPALMQLGVLYSGRWDRKPMPIWRRVLKLDPQHREARDALAQAYIEEAHRGSPQSYFLPPGKATAFTIKTLQKGLEELPGHPALLLELGHAYGDNHKEADARAVLRQAWESAPNDVNVVGTAMHELLHVGGAEIVTELLPRARQISGLRPAFWLDQGARVLSCELDETWAVHFWDEALERAQAEGHSETKAYTLVQIFELAQIHEADHLAEQYAQRIRQEVPHSGAVEYIDAFAAANQGGNRSQALRLIRKSQRVARKAGESGLADRGAEIEDVLNGNLAPGLLGGMDPDALEGFPGGRFPLEDLFENMDEEDLDELRRIFGL
jgi:tetratricopeptide (TPR) repeat protein